MAIIFFLLQLLAFLIIFIFFFPRKKSRFPPGPRGLPFIGNLHQFDGLNLHLYLHELSKKYGPFMSMTLGKVPVIVISSARLAKEVFTTNDLLISDRPKITSQQKLSYNGVDIAFSPYNDCWREMRRIAVIHLFSRKQVNSFSPIRQDEVCHMIKDISERAKKIQVINLSETVMSLSCSIICRAAFGKSYRETSVKRTFYQLSHEAEAILTSFFFADYIPWLSWIDKVTGMASRLEKCFKDLDSFYQELINEHLSPNRPHSMEGDILDLLIQLKQEQTTSIDISWDRIKAMLMNIFIAGTGTSSAVITWALTCLVKTPITMKKVQDEIRETVGNYKGRVDEDDILMLPYLKAVIKEALRLYPPGPLLLPRETAKSCLINGYEIKPKTLVHINIWSIGKDPEYWENPNEFLPDRFLNTTIDYIGQNFEFIPFGFGRRMCPGLSFGMATVELGLANLLYSFDWELPVGMTKDDVDTNALFEIVVRKKNPLCLMAKSYKLNN